MNFATGTTTVSIKPFTTNLKKVSKLSYADQFKELIMILLERSRNVDSTPRSWSIHCEYSLSHCNPKIRNMFNIMQLRKFFITSNLTVLFCNHCELLKQYNLHTRVDNTGSRKTDEQELNSNILTFLIRHFMIYLYFKYFNLIPLWCLW